MATVFLPLNDPSIGTFSTYRACHHAPVPTLTEIVAQTLRVLHLIVDGPALIWMPSPVPARAMCTRSTVSIFVMTLVHLIAGKPAA